MWFTKKNFAIILICLFISLVYYKVSFYDKEVEDDSLQIKIGRSILGSTQRELSARYNLKPSSFEEGVHKEDNLYDFLSLWFRVYRPLTKEEGRRILVESVEELLRQINTNSDFHQYMHQVPFTLENVDLRLFCFDEKGRSVNFPNILIFKASNGMVVFKTQLKENDPDYYTTEEETWEAALEIVQSQEDK